MREFWYGFFGSAFGVIAAAAMLAAALIAAAGGLAASLIGEAGPADQAVTTDAELILEIDLRGRAINESGRGGPAGGEPLSASTIARALHHAISDSRVTGAVIHTSAGSALSAAHAGEFARALGRLSDAGKPVAGFVENAEPVGLPASARSGVLTRSVSPRLMLSSATGSPLATGASRISGTFSTDSRSS